jgi:hypothetical protein
MGLKGTIMADLGGQKSNKKLHVSICPKCPRQILRRSRKIASPSIAPPFALLDFTSTNPQVPSC